ncbi:MAG: hypothetical protein Q9199_002306 [Rusavskia elegans]
MAEKQPWEISSPVAVLLAKQPVIDMALTATSHPTFAVYRAMEWQKHIKHHFLLLHTQARALREYVERKSHTSQAATMFFAPNLIDGLGNLAEKAQHWHEGLEQLHGAMDYGCLQRMFGRYRDDTFIKAQWLEWSKFNCKRAETVWAKALMKLAQEDPVDIFEGSILQSELQ